MNLRDYVINCIDGTYNDNSATTEVEKVNFLRFTFEDEYKYNIRNFKTQQLAFASWIAGLPGVFNCDYENHVIIELGKDFGLITDKSKEYQIDEFIDGWFNLVAENVFRLFKAYLAQPLSTEQILKKCIATGFQVKLPEIKLSREQYVEVKNKLELIGGKWTGGKVQAFVFKEDAAELLKQVANGEQRNIKKEYQFFGTPAALAARLVELAEIDSTHCILEPSAGQGAIIKAIHDILPVSNVHYCELMPLNKTFLEKISPVTEIGEDFLLMDEDFTFDRIVANPPFNKNQDIDHIRRMYDALRDGGRIVTIASKHWQHSTQKKETAFKNWLDEVNADIIEIEAGEFKESGTNIKTVILVIDKQTN